MYTIKAFTADGGEYWIHNPKSKNLVTGDPYFEVGDNINGSAEFTIYPEHPYYSYVEKLTTDITIYKDGEECFSGRVLYDDEDFNGSKKVYVEGEMGFLCDSIQRQAVYHNVTPKSFLQTVIDIHNSQVEERKQFTVGIVTVTDSNDSIYRYTNYETTREVIEDKLIDRLGGHLRIRKVDGVRYLDYLSDDDFYVSATQKIEFGKNLLDYAKNADATDLATCIIPLGATQDEQVVDGLDAYLTIEDVNAGVDYVTDDAAVATYGKIFKTVKYDDVTVAANLLTKAKEYLASVQYENLVLELSAIDLNLTDDTVDELEVGNLVHCVSTPNNVDAWYPLTKKKVYLTQFSKNTYTLGTESTNATYTSSNQSTTAELTKAVSAVPSRSEILAQALQDATDLINATVASGYAIHEPNEFIVADDPDYKNAAKNLWRWGYGGLAHYSNGYYGEADGIAITMDGTINGKMLMANSVYAESIDAEYTETLEAEISDAESNANKYTDSAINTVNETITTSFSTLNNQIALTVTDTKEAITQKNYVENGESETLDLDSWTMSNSYATISIAEYQNTNCIRIVFTSAGLVTFKQLLGTLPAGNFTIQMQIAYDTDYTKPSYARAGFSTSYTSSSTFNGANFYTVKRTTEATSATRTAYFGVYGYAGTIVYIKNMRVLQDYQELLDLLSASFTVSIGEIEAEVSEFRESQLHDYCVNGDFSADDPFSSWYRSNTTYVTLATFDGETCAEIANTSSTKYALYQKFTNPKEGAITVRFKAACASGYESTSRIQGRCAYGGTTRMLYTNVGELSTSWTQVEMTFSNVPEGTVSIYLYNHVNSTTVYVTDVEILGYALYYTDAQLTILSDSITSSINEAIETVEAYTDEQLGSYALSANVTNEIKQAIDDLDASITATLSSDYTTKDETTTLETSLKTLITANTTSITAEVTRAQSAETTLGAVDTKYGTCSTAASTAAKVVSCSTFTSSSLVKGTTICVYFTYKNSVASPTLNINSTGAKSIMAYGAALTATSDYNWPAKAYVTFVYSGSYWVLVDAGASSKIVATAESITATVAETYYTQSDAATLQTTLQSSITANTESITAEVSRATAAETTLSAADTKYGTCSTAASTKAKVVTCSSFSSSSLKTGATICVYFTYANTVASPTLNVNSTGAKTIRAYNAALTADSEYNWTAKSYVTFVYNGTYWCMVDAGASSKIEQLADSISLSVTSGTGGTASISLSVDGSTAGTGTVVSSARTAFANESSSITISAGTITFSSNTLVVSSSQFTLNSSGNATFSGTLSAASGTFNGTVTSTSGNYKAVLGSGNLSFYYSSTKYGSFAASVWSGTSLYGIAMHLTKDNYFMSFSRDDDGDGTYTAAYIISYSTSISDYRHVFFDSENHTGTVRFANKTTFANTATFDSNAVHSGYITLANNKYIYGTDTDGNARTLAALNSDDNYIFATGSVSANVYIGTASYTKNMYLRSAGDIYINSSRTGGYSYALPAIRHGSTTITPSAANTPTSVTLFWTGAMGGTPQTFVSAGSTVPGTKMLGVSSSSPSSTGVTIWLTRTDSTKTTVYYMIVY